MNLDSRQEREVRFARPTSDQQRRRLAGSVGWWIDQPQARRRHIRKESDSWMFSD